MLPEILALGAGLVAISPQLPEHNRELAKHRNLTFEILTDRGNEVAGKFGLRFALPPYLRELYATFPLDLAKFNGDSSWTLPIPGRFVVDRQGTAMGVVNNPGSVSPASTRDAARLS